MGPDNNLKKFDAAIMAGGPMAPFARNLPNKTFIKIRGRCLFAHVLNALLNATRIERIYIVGPRQAVENELAADTALPLSRKPVKVIPESRNLIDNMFNAFTASIEGYHPGEELNNAVLLEKPIFGVAGDCPLILPEEVDQFLERCDLARYDYFVGMTPEETLKRFYAHHGHRGIKLISTPFAEGLLRINNLHLAKPLRIAHRHGLQEMYQLRHLRKIRNIVKLGYELGKFGLTAEEWRVWAEMFIAIKARRMGFTRLAESLRRDAPMGTVIGAVDKILGTRSTIVLTTYGGAALDVDRPSNAPLFEANFDEWIKMQKSKTANPPE